MSEKNREGWLTEVGKRIEPVFGSLKLPPHRLSCSWPCKQALSRVRRIGECHGAKSSAGGVFELFISPLIAEPFAVADTIAHEMCHVAAGVEAAHGRGFVKVARHIGLTRGKPKEAGAGEMLAGILRRVCESVGPYPHAAIIAQPKAKREATSVGLECPECGCRVTISKKWLGEVGAPKCACGSPMGSLIDVEDDGE